jgi:hypothetical protein
MSDDRALAEAMLAAADEVIIEDLRGLTREFIKHAREMLRTGTPAIKAQLVKSVVPLLLRNSLEAGSRESEELAAMREQMAILNKLIRDGVAVRTAADPLAQLIPEDNPI